MTITRIRAVTVVLGGAALTAALTACGLLPPISATTAGPKRCTLRLTARPSVMTALIDRDERNIRAEVQAMLLTAPPSTHIFLRDLDTGNQLGFFTTPPGPALPGPTPPALLPPDPTQVQIYAYQQAITKYDAALHRDQALLARRWLARLGAWATRVTRQATASPETGAHQMSELSGLIRGLTSVTSDISSLEHIPGIHLGTRKILAILDLDVVPVAAPPPLPNLKGVTIAITGFGGTSRDQATWREQFTRAGASQAVLMTPATTDDLAAMIEPVLNQVSRHKPGHC